LNSDVVRKTVVGQVLFLTCVLCPMGYPAVRDITSFGAVANDPGDDLEPIAAAIAASSAGDTVFFPSGTFRVSGSIIPKSSITVCGAGRGST